MYEKIKNLCAGRGISIRSLEMNLGFSSGSICKWSENEPSFEKVKLVADYFGVSLDYFAERDGTNVKQQNDGQ